MLRFAFDMIVSNLKKYILSVLLMSISLLLIMFSLLIYKGEQYSYISCNDALNKGIDGTAVLRLDENSFIYNQEVKTFLKEAFERKEIYCIGSMVDYGCTYESLNELYEINSNFKTKKVILFSPTYRGTGSHTAYYNFELLYMKKIAEICKKTNSIFVIKNHPFIKKSCDIPKEYQEYIYDYSF